MKAFLFTVYISGSGENVDEAWSDAVEAFSLDPGVPPENYDEADLDEEGNS